MVEEKATTIKDKFRWFLNICALYSSLLACTYFWWDYTKSMAGGGLIGVITWIPLGLIIISMEVEDDT